MIDKISWKLIWPLIPMDQDNMILTSNSTHTVCTYSSPQHHQCVVSVYVSVHFCQFQHWLHQRLSQPLPAAIVLRQPKESSCTAPDQPQSAKINRFVNNSTKQQWTYTKNHMTTKTSNKILAPPPSLSHTHSHTLTHTHTHNQSVKTKVIPAALY